MVLDRASADAEFRGDVLAGITSEDQFHDFALPHSQSGDVGDRGVGQSRQLAKQFVPFASQRRFAIGWSKFR